MFDDARQKNFELFLSEMLERKTFIKSNPIQLFFGLTNICNLRCPFCPTHGSIFKDTENEHIPLDVLQSCKTYFLTACQFCPSLGGEPLLYKYLDEFIELAEDTGAIGAMQLITNGMKLDRCDLESLTNINNISISIDAADKRLFEIHRPGSNFDKLVKNIELLRDALPEVTLQAQMTVSRLNVTGIVDVYKFAKEKGFNHFAIVNVFGTPNNKVVQLLRLRKSDRKILKLQLEELEKLNNENGLIIGNLIVEDDFEDNVPLDTDKILKKLTLIEKHNTNHCFDKTPDVFSDSYRVKIENRGIQLSNAKKFVLPYCTMPYVRFGLLPSSNVLVCCANYPHIGNVTNKFLSDVWNGETVQTLRESMWNYDMLPDFCKQCTSHIRYSYINDFITFILDRGGRLEDIAVPPNYHPPVEINPLIRQLSALSSIEWEGHSVNSHNWWDAYFRNKLWDIHDGGEQTAFFAKLALENIPNEIMEEIKNKSLSICDVGCAYGDALPIFASVFANSRCIGIDYSETAIASAVEKYPEYNFAVCSFEEMLESYDVIYCSNVLEHFENPWEQLKQIINHCNRYAIVVVPFEEEPLHETHLYKFTDDFFKQKSGKFSLKSINVVDTSTLNPSHWNGKQAIAVYEKEHGNKMLGENGKSASPATWNNVAKQYSVVIDDGEFELAREIAAVLKQNGVMPGSRLLELGSGSGHLSACLAMAGYHTSLLDFSGESLNKAKETYAEYELQGEFINADIMNLDAYQENDYDLVWNSGVMEHFSDESIFEAFTNIKKVTNNKLLILVPNPNSISYLLMRYVRQSQKDWPYGKEYLRNDYVKAMESVGFCNITTYYLADAATKYNFWVATKDAIYCDAYLDMLDRGLLPTHEKYLVGYFASSSHITVQEVSVPCFGADVATLLYDLNSERYGLYKDNNNLGYQIKLANEEMQKLNALHQQTVEEKQQLTDLHQQTVEEKQKLTDLHQQTFEEKQHLLNLHMQTVEEKQQLMDLHQQTVEEKQQLMGQNSLLESLKSSLEETVESKNAIICNVRYTVNLLLATRMFKLVHLWSRFKYQLIKGSLVEKRNFFRWFFGRIGGAAHKSTSYSPLMRILDVIDKPVIIHPQTLQDEKNTVLAQDYCKFDVIILSIINYDFRYQRPQHIASRFSADGHRVFYFNANFNTDFSVVKENENLFIINISHSNASNIYETDWACQLDELQAEFDKVLKPYAIRDAVVIVDYPNWVLGALHLRKKFGFKILMDYMDEFTGFDNPFKGKLKENGVCLLKESDFVAASSKYLYDHAKLYNKNVELIRNGTDYEHFATASFEGNMKEKHVIGYYGAIAHWFGVEIVCHLAENLPDCNIVLIGDVTEHKRRLQNHPNIKLLGEKPYRELPHYLKTFDVCLIPFDTSTDLIKATNPVKFYEYLSAGKKIVATELPELAAYSVDYVLLANDKYRFLEHVKSCLSGTDGLKDKNELMMMGKSNDWNFRYKDMLNSCKTMNPKVSVVVLTYNNLKLNKLCIESIFSNTAYPNYELIVVDNLSTDGTRKYLSELQTHNIPNLKIILNDVNLGFAGGNNIGIKESDGDYVVLLNNDTIVTRGWMISLVKHLENDRTLGMSGPVTNSIGNEAQITASYSTVDEMRNFAYRYTWDHMGESFQNKINMLAMFAICIRREVIEKCGFLDESYSIGMFEDDDYCQAVKNSGYGLCIAEDAFVHHFDGSSFKRFEKKDYDTLFNKNRQIYEQKWSTKWIGHKYRDGVGANANAHIDI